jgi:hypothetical protein
MPNPLHIYVNSRQTVDFYKEIVKEIGQDEMFFIAMHNVADGRGFTFDLPSNASEYELKHREIELSLSRYESFPDKQGLFFDLIEEVQVQLKTNGFEPLATSLRNLAQFKANQDFKVLLNGNGAWQIEWAINNPGDSSDERTIPIVVYHRGKEVVSWTVVQYINSAILLFKQKSYATSLALLSIAVEATLRDLLYKKGYNFVYRASKVNVYEYLSAQINVDADYYTISFANNPILKPPTDLPTSAGGSLPINVQIRREIKPDDGRVDLRIKEIPEFLLDHMSSNIVERPAEGKNIGSLEEALRVARKVEGVVTPMDLPTNIDKVLTSVRNKLIHLSNYSLDEELPGFASENPTGRFTVKDFVEKPNYVFDFVLDIPRFVNDQYLKP